ncbi:MAG: class I SAM-dependent DNA methyltransferase [Nannocystales bacterium]
MRDHDGANKRALQRRIRDDARATYDAFAPEYDEHLQSGCSYASPARVAQAVARLQPSGRWLDVGAGTGLLGEALASHEVRLELVGLDVSAAMLAQVRCPLYVACHRGDVLTRIPGKELFDGAMASGLMEYVVDVPALFRRVGRRLREGGVFVFTFSPTSAADVRAFDDESDLHAHDPEHVRGSLDEAGFVDATMSRAFRAYQNADVWVRHRIVIARRGAVLRA